MTDNTAKLTEDNYESKALRHLDRQAGISVIYDPTADIFVYNAYCLELKLLKELSSCEYDTLDKALIAVNEEFGSWSLVDLAVAEGCCQSGGCGGGGCCGKHHKEE